MTKPPAPQTAYIANAGAAAIGARLRRISERIDREATKIYSDAGIRFEQRWFGVVSLLSLYGPQSVSELAKALGVSHATVSQIRRSLAQAKLIAWKVDPQDARQRLLRLSPNGIRLVARLKPIWAALSAAAIEINNEAEDTLSALVRLEDSLARLPLYERAKRQLTIKW